jgi:hypothetical protein
VEAKAQIAVGSAGDCDFNSFHAKRSAVLYRRHEVAAEISR